MFALLIGSCQNSLNKDAEKIAQKMCESNEITGIDEVSLKEIEKIEEKYSKEERRELERLAEDIFMKKCGEKGKERFNN
jgi:hypothetical protein